MRIMPLAVWASNFYEKPEMVYNAIKSDVEFTHSNILVKNAIFLYTIAI